MNKMRKLLAMLFAIHLLSACGVEVHAESSVSSTSPRYLEYTVLMETDRNVFEELAADCIDFSYIQDDGAIYVDDWDESLEFFWILDQDLLDVGLKENGYQVSQSTYHRSFFKRNEVSQEVISTNGQRYLTEIKRDSFCR